MKKLFILPLLGLLACQQNNPQPNTSTNNGSGTNGNGSANTNGNYIECTGTDNIPWNPNVNYGSVTDIDGNEYKTVTIGNQEWMAENLKTTHYANGDEIPYVFSGDLEEDSVWCNTQSGAFCWYLEANINSNFTYDTTNYKNCYGGLYNFYAVEDSRNVCPTGWHVPSENEFYVLFDYIDTLGGYSIGESLGAVRVGHYDTGTDDFGLRIIDDSPYRWADFSIHYIPINCGFSSGPMFWTSSLNDNSDDEYDPVLYFSGGFRSWNSDVRINYSARNDGMSIRCLRD